MKYEKIETEDGRVRFEVIDDTGLVAEVTDEENARMFAAADELLRCAEDALSYVSLFGQLNMGTSTATSVAKKLKLAIAAARGEKGR